MLLQLLKKYNLTVAIHSLL